jgi:asparagine synthase (glutamine-hydrolysing)
VSGIAGVVYFDGRPVTAQIARNMIEAMPHRIRDGLGEAAVGAAAFGHGMLITQPRNRDSELPLILDDCMITADARIDNRAELIAWMGIPRSEIATVPDAALILRAYLKWGPECAERLCGDFAFALWDERKKTFICARDHLGVKPLVLYRSDSFVAFGSEPKAILALPDVPYEFDEERLCFHFYPELLLDDKRITFHRGIERLEPAHICVATSTSVRTKCYWCLDPLAGSDCSTEEQYIARFRELFFQSVDARLATDARIASTLSGGLDSSSVTCTARDLLESRGNPTLRAYSAVFDEVPQADERSWMAEVTADGRLKHCTVHPDAETPLIDIDKVLWLMDGPFYGTNYFLHWATYRAAAADNVRVMLDGEDGDTTVSHGIDQLMSLVQSGKWREFAAECDAIVRGFDNERTYASKAGMLRAHGLPYLDFLASNRRWGAFCRGVNGIHRNFGVPWRQLLISHGLKKIPSAAKFKRVVRPSSRKSIDQNSVLNDEFMRKYCIQERLDEVRAKYRSHIFPAGSRQEHLIRLSSGALTYTLEALDRMAAYWGIEVRHPFCDFRLVEFALSVPPPLKLRNGVSRYILREALSGTLPDPIRHRAGKGDLSDVSERGLRVYEHDAIASVARQSAKFGYPYLDAKRVRAVAQRAMEPGSADAMASVWRTLTLARWMEADKR